MPPPYATPQHFISTLDRRTGAILTSDENFEGELSEDNRLLADALMRASYDVSSHALRGRMYTPEDLDDAYAAGDWTLIGLVCDMAVRYLAGRRSSELPPDLASRIEEARRTLEDLRSGKLVFVSIPKAHLAGLPQAHVPSAWERREMNLGADSPFFPDRRTELI